MSPVPGWWCDDAQPVEADIYVGFRGAFELPVAGEVEFRLLGASWYVAWLEGEFLAEGPARFRVGFPEYQTVTRRLPAGKHLLAAHVHHEGVCTRMLQIISPFLFCQIDADGNELPITWKCARLEGYKPRVRRINDQFGWIEWCNTRKLPANWQAADFDDASWNAAVAVRRKLGELKPLSIAGPRHFVHAPAPVAHGPLAEVFGYGPDNPAARFFLRDLVCRELPAQGAWRRYDLGRVRLMRPRFVLDVPTDAVVEFAYSESLSHGRVAPWIPLSASDSCNFDHYVARGGVQEFFPLTPKGGRYVEVHVLAPPEQIRFVKEEFVERGYFDAPQGLLQCDDPLLERIWTTGIETLRGCAEDALTDNPTRERGQWAGDVATVGMEIAAVGYSDLRLFRRALVQCAQCARADGMVAGLCPGGVIYLATYALQWVTGCVRHWELTGDRALLAELFPAAERNLSAFENFLTADGLSDKLDWAFVDWGYVRNDGPSDMAVNLHYLAALRDMGRWCAALGRPAGRYHDLEGRVRTLLQGWFASHAGSWPQIGYHRAVLGVALGFFREQTERDCVAFIKAHQLDCFPNNPAAPRLSDPNANHPRLITPYFAHYALPPLIERGEMDFALDQYRCCWGWALEGGRTTWLEVFDTRWSHCHQWAGCPTWQLSRYLLGLHARFDLGHNHFSWNFQPGSIRSARGALPLADGVIAVEWERSPAGVHYRLQTPQPIWIHETLSQPAREVKDKLAFVWKGSAP